MLSENQLIDRVAQVYGNCSTYRDEGFARLLAEDSQVHKSCLFRTFFQRPHFIRVEWKDTLDSPKNTNVALFNGAFNLRIGGHSVRLDNYLLDHQVRKHAANDLELMFVSAAAGISLGVTMQVPPILMPNLHLVDTMITHLHNYSFIAQSTTESHFQNLMGKTDSFEYVLSVNSHYAVKKIQMKSAGLIGEYEYTMTKFDEILSTTLFESANRFTGLDYPW